MTFQKGASINGYVLVENFKEDGGGNGRWARAVKNNKEYFIKMFLRPKYPTPESYALKDPSMCKRDEMECKAFEDRHIRIMKTLLSKERGENGNRNMGGNIVVTRDFFRHTTTYYKVTDWIDAVEMTIGDVSNLEPKTRVKLMRVLSSSLQFLHGENIVHGDLKPDNILIKITGPNNYTAKLIDYDDGYFSGNPPENPEEMVGEQRYYSPELGLYMSGEITDRNMLTTKSDIFALGLIFHEIMCGVLPDIGKFTFPYHAVIERKKALPLQEEKMPNWCSTLINRMLDLDFAVRPSIEDVYHSIPTPDRWDKDPKESNISLKGDLAYILNSKELDSKLRGKGLSLIKDD